ncbi:lysozyme [Clostridium sp. HBUAS56010]|uniref:lysozyme n=1 Tax=Clostridium sp. HBUAS56010 TaxID=2571127 RepID=UPI001178ADD3|nr:lysozyme [Clostridium sp. HBUAS56010]
MVEVPNGNSSEFIFGNNASALLKYIELPYPPYSDAYIDYFVMDGNNIKEIYFQFAGDWGITLGWGTYIPTIDGHGYDVTEEGLSMLKKHGMTDKDIKYVNDLIIKYKSANKDGRKTYYEEIKKYFQGKKLKITIKDCDKYFKERLDQHAKRINKLKNTDYLKLKMNQDQFNALVIHRYCRGSIYENLDEKLKVGKGIVKKLFQQPAGYEDRGETEYNIFMLGIYEYQGHKF